MSLNDPAPTLLNAVLVALTTAVFSVISASAPVSSPALILSGTLPVYTGSAKPAPA